MCINDSKKQPGSPKKVHGYQDLIRIFDDCFAASFNTRLVAGSDEPVYLPAGAQCNYHQVVFAHGFYASALHEIAHWCIAGEKRRLQEDYGYWYCPDGRNAKQQAEFEKVEIKPQALEWLFSVAAGTRFRVSTDNLNGAEPDRAGFTQNVRKQVAVYLKQGLPPRAAHFVQALQLFYQTKPIQLADFSNEETARV